MSSEIRYKEKIVHKTRNTQICTAVRIELVAIPQSDLSVTIVISMGTMMTLCQSTTYDDRRVKIASWNAPLINCGIPVQFNTQNT